MIRGTKRAFVKQPSREVSFSASIHNRFDIEVVDSKTGEIKQRAQAENTICDQMWTRMLSTSSGTRRWFSYIHYGKGDGTPAPTDTSLFSFVSAVSMSGATYNCDPVNGVFSIRRSIVLGSSDAVGSTITEVGIGYDKNASNLCTHAMLTDMNGNKISITKTDTDILNIYATVFLHYNPDGYQNGDVRIHNISPSSSLIARLIMGCDGLDISSYYFAAVPTYGSFGGPYSKYVTQTTYYTKATASFDVPNKRISIVFDRVEPSKMNVDGGYGGIYIDNALSVRAGGLSIPSNRIIGETVGNGDGVTTDFSTKFGFAHDATVYVDGVKIDDVTVDCVPKCVTEMGRYFIRIHENGCYYGSGYCLDGGLSVGPGNAAYFENPYYEYGIASINTGNYGYSKIYGSNDLKDWVLIRENGNGPVLAGHEYDRYFKIVNTHGSSSVDGPKNFVAKDLTEYNIHFNTPPADGAVITIDYITDTAAKDENHVFDFSLEISLGEYNPNT